MLVRVVAWHADHAAVVSLQALTELFKPILHTQLLIWQHSRYWNSLPRLVAVMREVCNDLIMQARKFIPGGCSFGRR